MSLYQIISGPMVWVSFLLFIIGTIFQIIQLFPLGRPVATPGNCIPSYDFERYATSEREKGRIPYYIEALLYKMAMLKYTLMGRAPFMIIISTLFHCLLIFSPLFVLGHNVLLKDATGLSFPSVSPGISSFAAMLVILCALFFLVRRLSVKLVRSITTRGDYLMLLIAAAPFITGMMAHYQVVNYDAMVHLHILSGEIMLICIPFTKFIHMIYFLITRIMSACRNAQEGSDKRAACLK